MEQLRQHFVKPIMFVAKKSSIDITWESDVVPIVQTVFDELAEELPKLLSVLGLQITELPMLMEKLFKGDVQSFRNFTKKHDLFQQNLTNQTKARICGCAGRLCVAKLVEAMRAFMENTLGKENFDFNADMKPALRMFRGDALHQFASTLEMEDLEYLLSMCRCLLETGEFNGLTGFLQVLQGPSDQPDEEETKASSDADGSKDDALETAVRVTAIFAPFATFFLSQGMIWGVKIPRFKKAAVFWKYDGRGMLAQDQRKPFCALFASFLLAEASEEGFRLGANPSPLGRDGASRLRPLLAGRSGRASGVHQ